MSDNNQKVLLLNQYRKISCLGQWLENLSDINPMFIQDRSECSAISTK